MIAVLSEEEDKSEKCQMQSRRYKTNQSLQLLKQEGEFFTSHPQLISEKEKI